MNSNGQDFVGAGFRQLDEDLVKRTAPKIKWGMIYEKMNEDQKISYLEKLAATMNHAAYLIQEERNKLLALCSRKEQQIESMAKALTGNSAILQEEITRMNEERQATNQHVAKLNTRIRELERQVKAYGDND